MLSSPSPVLSIQNLSIGLPALADRRHAIKDLSLSINPGETLCVVGESGSGKSMTAMAVIGLLPGGVQVLSGSIRLGDRDLLSLDEAGWCDVRGREVGTVFQEPMTSLNPVMRVADQISETFRAHNLLKPAERDRRVLELLAEVNLPNPELIAKAYPHELSGGQRQRVGVARALAADPVVLLMDEPFSAVDPVVRERLQSEFLRLQETVRKTIVFVTHDIEEAVRIGDRIAVMSHGGHVEQFATPADLLGRPANAFVADFVGADRGLKRLAVTGIDTMDLERPPVVHVRDGVTEARAAMERAGARWAVVLDDEENLHGWLSADRAAGAGTVGVAARRMEAWVPVDASLKTAMAVMLQQEAGWVAVLDGDRFLGVLTPDSLHAALRRSVEGTVPETAGSV
jgi:osmoprotectant transport system ATP-binding protein